MNRVYVNELALARLALRCGNFDVSFEHLERAHVLAQRMTFEHVRIHWLMAVVGSHRRDHREVVGQFPRMLAALLFSTVWVPRGNTGRARVNAFKPMPIPENLRHLVR